MALKFARRILVDSRCFYWVAVPLMVFELALNILIVSKVPYTEIDWKTYMQQIAAVVEGERNYSLIRGDTGPLVYPAGFVWIYRCLYWLTEGGTNIFRGQLIFIGIYMFNFLIVMCIYRHSSKIPPYALVFLALSKRLHSIYTLRLFNDPVATLFAHLAVLALLRGRPLMASLLMSAGISVKMCVLLWVPGLAWILWCRKGWVLCAKSVALMIAFQVCIALPFVVNYPREYFARAFEFGRVFIFKWSVNWKFLSPEFFTSPQFAAALLATHAMLLLAITVGVWSRPFGTFATVLRRGLRSGRQAGPNFLDPDYIIFIMFSCNLIGIVCARTLHYQFYSWYCHTLPYLMFLKPLPFNSVLGSIALLAIVEWCWNIFPATPGSSLVLLAAHAIVLRTLFSVQFPPQPPPIKRD